MNYDLVLGGADDLSDNASAVSRLTDAYVQWRDLVLEEAGSTDDSEGNAGTLRNLAAAAGRQLKKFLGGDDAQGPVLQQTMDNTMILLQQIDASNLPSLYDFYHTTSTALHDLVVAVAKTAGQAAGSAIKAASDAANIDLNKLEGDTTSTLKWVAGAVGLSAAAYIFSIIRRRK